MPTKAGTSEIVDCGDASGIARIASERIASALRDAITRAGSATIALSGGETPRETYTSLARDHAIDWSRTHVFLVDERAVPPTHERSNYRWARATLLDAAPVPAGHVHRMRAEAPDLEQAAREYEALIREHVLPDASGVPSFDAAVMGLGDDGHTASLFPGEPTVSVDDRLVAAVPPGGAHEARLTITRPMIEHARKLLFLVAGAAKVPALKRVLADEGDIRETPARITRQCLGTVEWLVDDVLAKTVGG